MKRLRRDLKTSRALQLSSNLRVARAEHDIHRTSTLGALMDKTLAEEVEDMKNALADIKSLLRAEPTGMGPERSQWAEKVSKRIVSTPPPPPLFCFATSTEVILRARPSIYTCRWLAPIFNCQTGCINSRRRCNRFLLRRRHQTQYLRRTLKEDRAGGLRAVHGSG